MKKRAIYILTGLLFFITFSCSTTKHLKDGQLLLKKNKVIFTQKANVPDIYTLNNLIKQKPNKRLFGFLPVKLWWHNIFPKAGEAPVVYDKNQTEYSRKRMLHYLKSLGYFNAKIRVQEKNIRKKMVVKYLISPGKPYLVQDYSYFVKDSAISGLLLKYRKGKLIKPGDNYNEYTIDKERNRVTSILNNEGYYKFSRECIRFSVDTNLNNHRANIRMLIKKIPGNNSFTKYHYGELSLRILNSPYQKTFDTSFMYHFKNRERLTKDSMRIYYSPPLRIKPKLISRNMFLHSGDKYNLSRLKKTVQRLNRLSISKRININLKEDDSLHLLDARIDFIKKPAHYYSVEAQGTNRGGDLGVGGILNYSNRNLFRSSELFNFRLKGALEFQHFTGNDTLSVQNEIISANTIEWGMNASVFFPFLVAPVSQERYFMMVNPQSVIDVGYNFQKRIDYRRTVSYASLAYKWRMGNSLNYRFYPLELSFVKVDLSPGFEEQLQSQPLRIRDLYQDHLIAAIKFSLIYGKTSEKRKRNSFYYRSDMESSGNLLDFLVGKEGTKPDEDFKTIFGVRFAQYLKWSNDFRYYLRLNADNTLAFRSFLGVGVPLRNSSFLPLERAYFGGGANGMRAWRLRYLGPGAFPGNGKQIERFGDLMLEGNFEYRFPVYRFLYGALFFDAGNIWLINDNHTYPDGAFALQTFAGELAMDTGLGFRFDFTYFMFRLDIAQRLKDPALPLGQRWVFGQKKWLYPVLNFGIGFPF